MESNIFLQKTVFLNNGQEINERYLEHIMYKLRSLVGRNPIAFMELVRYCRDEHHKLHPIIADVLQKLIFLRQNSIAYPRIKEVVCCAVVGTGIDMKIVNPRKLE